MPRPWETTRPFFLSAPRSAFAASRWCSLPAGCFPKLLQRLPPGHSVQGLPRSGNSPAQTSASLHPPAALRLRVLPFTRTWSSTVCAEEFPTPLEKVYLPDCICPLDCCCSDRRKSVGPSAPIAYATSVSPPDEAAARQVRSYWMLDEAGALPMSLHRE